MVLWNQCGSIFRVATGFFIQTQLGTCKATKSRRCSGQGFAGTSSVLTCHASCLILAVWWRVLATLIDDSDLQRIIHP